MRPANVCGLKKSKVNIHNPPLDQASVAALSAMLALLRTSLARKSCARNFASARGKLQIRLRAWKASTEDAISFFADFPRKSHVLRRCSWRPSWRGAASTTLVMPSASSPACALSSTQIERANPAMEVSKVFCWLLQTSYGLVCPRICPIEAMMAVVSAQALTICHLVRTGNAAAFPALS